MDKQVNSIVESHDIIEENTGWVAQVLVIGGVVGALTGLGAAYLLVQRAKKRGGSPNLSAFEGVKLGLLIFGLLRQVSLLGGDEK